MKYAVFIEPRYDFFEAISMWKKNVEEEFPNAPYLSHPPHATLIFTHLKDVASASELLKMAVASQAPFAITSEEKIAFYDDPLAGGGHTMAYRLRDSKELFELQKCCAEALEPIIDHGHESLSDVLSAPMFRESFSRFAFPFVGTHWIPHMTVASLPVERDDPLLDSFMSVHMRLECQIEAVSLWAVDADEHEKLESFSLKKNDT